MSAASARLSRHSVLVAGAGSIGRRHMGNLRKLGFEKIAATDPDSERLAAVAKEFGVQCLPDFAQALADHKPDAVFVCTPPVYHTDQARQAVRNGAHVFVEKPISDRLEGLKELAEEAHQRSRVVQVGYNLRAHPGVVRLKRCVEESAIGKILWARVEVAQYLPDWRPWQDYRKSYTAQRSLGGGIILDASHEIDYILWLLGAPAELTCMAGKVSQLDVDVEDSATILIRMASGAQVDVHMDFVQRSYARSCVLAGENGKLLWDFEKNQVSLVPPNASPEIHRYDFESNQMYVAEIEHFFESIDGNAAPLCGIADARLTLQVALAAKESAADKKWVRLD